MTRLVSQQGICASVIGDGDKYCEYGIGRLVQMMKSETKHLTVCSPAGSGTFHVISFVSFCFRASHLNV